MLMYHRVLKTVAEESVFVQPGMYVSLDNFRCQMIFLKERFDVLPLDRLITRFKAGQCLRGCCSITFDDGWHDNFSVAFPVLREFQLPATIFLATDFIGSDRLFWPEALTYYLRRPDIRDSVGQRSQAFTRLLGEIDIKNGDDSFLDSAVAALKKWSPFEREELIQYLRASSSALPLRGLTINWEEAREMQLSGLITFGAHTANHVILDQVSQLQAEDEILQSRNKIENQLGITPEIFAYPNGNFTAGLKTILQRYGFMGAVSTRKACLEQGNDFFEIPRIGIHEDVSRTIPMFLARIFLKGF